MGACPATRFNEADTNYTICDINVTNCYSKIIYINIEDKDFLTQLAGTNSINLAAALLYSTPFLFYILSLLIRQCMTDTNNDWIDPEHIYGGACLIYFVDSNKFDALL